jgi:hypothetical protein
VKSAIIVWLLLVTFATVPAAIGAAAQNDNPPQQGPPPFMQPQQRPSPADEARERMEKDMAKKANQQRWDQLKRDTDNLLKLSTQLKEYVDKANENTLSLDVIKKAEEIEKLAHSVKDKMRGD